MKIKSKFTVLVVSAITFALVLMAGISAYAFSDEYEPIYPHITAVTRSTEEIYQRISAPDDIIGVPGKVGETMQLPESVRQARIEMIEMYKKIGIDISLDMENWGGSARLMADYPSRWSTETPIPLGESPDYSGAFSIDAPWNNKIPAGAPRIVIPVEGIGRKAQLAVCKTNLDDGGYGTGIAQVVGKAGDPEYSIIDKYNNNEVVKGKILKMHVPENAADLLNQPNQGDEHALFIDADKKTAVQTWKTRIPGDHRGYSIDNYLIPGFDVRCHTVSYQTRLDGIGSEEICGGNAAKLPTSAFTLKTSEVQSTTEFFNHAIGGAISDMVGARVYPAAWTDAHMAMSGENQGSKGWGNRGVVPYGGIVQLDPEIDLKALYDGGKISFHAYRILKCMQEYGFYNIDCSGYGESLLIYTSTVAGDWTSSTFDGFKVPYENNAQGFPSVARELEAFLQGNEFFGLAEQPILYHTIPVAKYADLDVNDDGAIDQTDYDLILENVDAEYSDTNKQYDVNQDKEISIADVEIMYNYLNDLPMHTFNYYDISIQDNDSEHGDIVITAPNVKVDGIVRYKEGNYGAIAAVANPGYEFAGWTGDLAGETDNVVTILVDKDYVVGAKYKKSKDVKFTTKVAGPGHVEASYDNITFDAPEKAYGVNTLIKIKAVPDEGYSFLGWYGDVSGYSTTADILVTKDTEVIALFGEADYAEPFNPDEWEVVSGNDNYVVSPTSKSISFKDFSLAFHMVGKKKTTEGNPDLTGDFKLRADLKSGAVLPTHAGMLMFNYKDAKNYYYMRIDGNGQITLSKKFNGIDTALKKSEAYPVNENGVKFELPMTVEVERKGSFIYVYAYKNGNKLEYFRVRDKSLKGGTYGAGARHHAYITISNIKVTTSVVNPDDAVEQNWVNKGASDIWTDKLKSAVVVAADSDKAYVNDYVSITEDGSIKPYYAEDGETVYVPLRYVVENLGGSVSWDAATDHVVATLGDASGNFKDGENGAEEKNGTLYVSAQALADAIGKKLYKYRAVMFFSDTEELFTVHNENECISFVEKAFGIKYEIR